MADDTGEGEIIHPSITPERQERWDLLANLTKTIPYWRYPYNMNKTFGQASKICDWVVVGTVAEPRPADLRKDVTYHSLRKPIVLSADTFLYGKRPWGKLIFTTEPGYIEDRTTKPGDRVLVFLADKRYKIGSYLDAPPSQDLTSFDFDRTAAKPGLQFEKTEGVYTLSHIILDNKEAEEEATRAAKGYLGFFGGKGKRDKDKYYEFLCSLLASPFQRIRDDAESDLILFYTREKEPPPDLDKLLADDRVRKEIKDYLRFRLRNEKPDE